MRMLRKKGTNQVYIYTELLATHPDIEVFDTDGDTSLPPAPSPAKAPGGLFAALHQAQPAAPQQPAAPAAEAADESEQATNVYDITNPDTLRAMLRDRGVKISTQAGVKTMQDRLAGLMTAESEAA